MSDAARRADRRPVNLPAGGVAKLLPPAAYYSLRGDAAVMQRAGDVIGAEPSQIACRAVSGPAWSALWLGPDEQMLVGPVADQSRFEASLSAVLAELPHSLVDVSHRQISFEVAGPNAAALLNTACPLDLDVAAFPVSMVTRTVFAKVEIVLWRRAVDRFQIDVWRSYANYLNEFLNTASRNV